MMELFLMLSEGARHDYGKQRLFLKKEVPWIAPPQLDGWVLFGLNEHGEQGEISARVSAIGFGTDGSITVEARCENLGATGEWDIVVGDARRDGFEDVF